MKYSYLIISLLLLFSGCADEFLEVPPTKNGVIPTKVSDLQKFYEGGMDRNSNNYSMLITDDVDLPITAYDIEVAGGLSKYIQQFYPVLFQRDYLSKSLSGSKSQWQSYYSKIYNDNYVLSMADSDMLEGSKQERKEVKSFAHFDRACSLFQLAQTFCQPWAPGKNDDALGLVLKSRYTLDFDSENLGRKSLKETYEFIEKDLLASFDIPNTDENWKFTLKAVHAFAARFYLTIGNYTEALKYADLALGENNALEDYTTYTKRLLSVRKVLIQVVPEFYDKTIYNDYSLLDLKTEYLVEYMQVPQNLLIPSMDLLNLYNGLPGEDDVRNWLFSKNGLATTGYFKDKKTLSTTGTYPFLFGYNFGGFITTFPNVPEVMLIKAECLVRQNKGIDEAKALLNRLRQNRILNYDPSTVDNLASNEEVLNFVYDERRRERPFLLRAMDMRRLYALEGRPLNVTRHFFEITENSITVPAVPKDYVLTEADLANKLFEGDITLSNGYLEQNP